MVAGQEQWEHCWEHVFGRIIDPRHSPLVKGLYCTLACTLACTLGPGTEDTKVSRPKGSCFCEIPSLVGTKKH